MSGHWLRMTRAARMPSPVGGRHPDVGDHHVGPFPLHRGQQPVGVGRGGRDLESGAVQQLGQAGQQ
jgi:hypothetical protein